MHTDTFFYGFLKTYPHLVLALVGETPATAYRFTALEVKQKNFRFDGVLIPESLSDPIWFVEVQFQRRVEFYWDFFTKVALYLSQERETRPVRLVAIFPQRSVDVAVPEFYTPQVALGWLRRVYLNEWQPACPSWEAAVLQLASIPVAATVERIAALRQELGEPEGEVLDWLQTFLIYRYPQLGWEEIARMFTLEDLRKTRSFQQAVTEGRRQGLQEGRQEGRQEGLQEGRQEGACQLLLRLIEGRFGPVDDRLRQQIQALSSEQREALGLHLWECRAIADVEAWLAGIA